MTESKGRDSVKQISRPIITISNFNHGSGLSVVGKVFDKAINFLVDTGSAITLVSDSVFQQLDCTDIELSDVPFEVCLADGQTLGVKGQTTMDITLGPLKVEHMVIIADIQQQAILGMDFMTTQECKLDLPQLVMKIQGKEVNMWNEDQSNPQCCRVSLAQDETVCAYTEKILLGRVARKGNEAPFNLIEGTNLLKERTGLMVARSLSDIRSGSVLVRVCNPGSTDVNLYKGTTLAIGEPVEVTNTCNVCNIHTESKTSTDHSNITDFPEHLQDVLDRGSVHLSTSQKEQLKQKLIEFSDVISSKDDMLGRTNITKYKINTGTEVPIRQKVRRVPMHMQDQVDKAMQDMIEKDVIEPSSSPWQSNVVLVKKKDGSLRFCIDYRPLNKITVKDSYRLPSIAESLDFLSGSSLFSCLDLASGYWQVEMDPDDKQKTAFATSRHGLYQFKVMPFGLCNALSTFERLMESVLSGLQFETLLVYLNDIIIPCTTFEQGLQRLEQVFRRLRQAGLKLKAKKCSLFQQEVVYLGHKVSKEGIHTDDAKISAVKEWPTPQNVHEVRSFMGLCSYYRKFIKNFAEIARPLHKLTEKNVKFVWSDNCTQAFQKLKECLICAPVLAYPSLDHTFILDTDASNDSIGAVLSQVIDGQERVIAYGSKALLKAERNYCVTRRELLAAVYFMKQYKHYLYGKKFLLRTDHGALKWLFKFKDPSGQIARWLETLAMFNFDIEHRPGRQHGNADGLSRVPCRQCGFG